MKIFPSKEEFRAHAEKGNLVPVCLELVADMDTPVSAYCKITDLDAGGDAAMSFLLESVEGEENIGRYSILGNNPRAVFTQKNGEAELVMGKTREKVPGANVFERVRNVLKKFQFVSVPGLPPFIGGAVGFASYDVVSEIERTVRQPDADPIDAPEAFFMITDCLLVFDRVLHSVKVISLAHVTDKSQGGVDSAYATAVSKIKTLAAKLEKPVTTPPVFVEAGGEGLKFESNKTRAEYAEMVRRAKQHILDGDIIQVVLSQRFAADNPHPPFAVYRGLRTVNPSPYMYLLNCGEFSIVGASPEVHAKCENGKMTVRPIAGTRKRGGTPEEDAEMARELVSDPKERAEHIMLVDLARNDLGRIAETGSVRVDRLMFVERYSHVMHIVSNVVGSLDTEKHGPDAVMASTFPAGTLSGAPKVKAMQIISELEKERRGPYGGTVAYFSFNGNVNSCITIRTALLKDGKAYVQSGGGIVADSDPDLEFEETCNKAKAMMKALSLAKFFDGK